MDTRQKAKEREGVEVKEGEQAAAAEFNLEDLMLYLKKMNDDQKKMNDDQRKMNEEMRNE